MVMQEVFVYNGGAGIFHEWEVRMSLGMFGAQSTEERSSAVSNTDIMDGLRGDEFTVVQQVGNVSLAAPAGITTMIRLMR